MAEVLESQSGPGVEPKSPHTFHIPVMGIGFTADTPLRVAKYGISSVVSLVDDHFLDELRGYHAGKAGLPFEPISDDDPDPRAHRITAYLNLLDVLVRRSVEELQAAPLRPGSDLWRYYELIPECPLKEVWRRFQSSSSPEDKTEQEARLRRGAVPGSVDVNIMTKLDRDAFRDGVRLAPEFADAMAAFRGFAKSTLRSAMVLSAGMNQRLYAYAAQFPEFLPDEHGRLPKRIILKVSDYRSAEVQGAFLAKKGLWVSEYRIESGLNCGGHAFPGKGLLMGPILEEFKQRRQALIDRTHGIFVKALASRGRTWTSPPLEVRVTAQGGIGTADEDRLLLQHYRLDGTGWATPFLLVPEVANVDDDLLQRLLAAKPEDVYLSEASPLQVPFWNLRQAPSEEARRQRVAEGHPGSVCRKGHGAVSTEFGEVPQCESSRWFAERKLAAIAAGPYNDAQRERLRERLFSHSCICHDLSGGARRKYGIDPQAMPAVCPGPNLVHFKRRATLDEMVAHIYGRASLLAPGMRPHMFVKELELYVEYMKAELGLFALGLSNEAPRWFTEFRENLAGGVEYYRKFAADVAEAARQDFLDGLEAQVRALEGLPPLPTSA